MTGSKIRNDLERWLIHDGYAFESIKNPENSFQILIHHAGPYGIPVEIFEPKSQSGVIVIGAKILLKNNQIARYLGFNEEEKIRFKKKIEFFCNSIRAISRLITEDGKIKIGVFVVLDSKENITQQRIFDAIVNVSEMHEKTSYYLMKTF